jgi:hypothetical protein
MSDEKHWVWVVHRKSKQTIQFPQDEVLSVTLQSKETILTIKMHDGSFSFFPVDNLESWHLLELPTDPLRATGR